MTSTDLPPPIAEPANIGSGVHLVWGSGSGPAQRVQIALVEKGIPFSGHMVSFSNKDTRRADWIGKLNPRRQVPILIDDGYAVSQSMSILLYLEEKFPQKPLLASGDLKLKTETVTRMIESDEVFRKLVQQAFQVLMANQSTQEVKNNLFKEMGEELDKWEAYLAKNAEKYSGGWLVGPSLSVADIAAFPTLMMLVERFGLSFGKRQRLDAWYKTIVVRESVQKSIPPHWAESPPKDKFFEGVEI
ncbi:hypothetical protein HDU97_009127 [Phlyctochytrium planicorne]|nr:hypothetical protein HDU97_009127 [Phlyctochytrium planicorne]